MALSILAQHGSRCDSDTPLPGLLARSESFLDPHWQDVMLACPCSSRLRCAAALVGGNGGDQGAVSNHRALVGGRKGAAPVHQSGHASCWTRASDTPMPESWHAGGLVVAEDRDAGTHLPCRRMPHSTGRIPSASSSLPRPWDLGCAPKLPNLPILRACLLGVLQVTDMALLASGRDRSG